MRTETSSVDPADMYPTSEAGLQSCMTGLKSLPLIGTNTCMVNTYASESSTKHHKERP